jgi:acyl-CoA hydrolase
MTIAKPVSASQTELIELMVPGYTNFGGNVHGGVLLSLMDKAAYVCSSKHAEGYCVTVAVEGVEFLNPVQIGSILSIRASVNFVGRTSMIVGMRVVSLDPISQKETHTNSCYFTMAAMNSNGTLQQVPRLLVEGRTELRRWCEGHALREISKQKRKSLRTKFEGWSLADLEDYYERNRDEESSSNS